MPATQPARIAQALPFALEEHVLADPDSLHCAGGPRIDGDLACAAIDREWLRALLDPLAAHGLFPDHACPDSLCIPWDEGTVTVVQCGDRALVRWGPCDGMVTEAPALDAVLEGIASGLDGKAAGTRKLRAGDLGEFVQMCAPAAGTAALDLLQGEFLPGQRRAGWRTWRLPAALAAALLLAVVSIEALETRQLSSASAALADEIGSRFRVQFPAITRMQSDPAPQIEQELRRLRQQAGAGGDQFLDLLALAAPVLSASPDVRLDRLQYSDGLMELALTANRIADFDQLRTGLQAAGLNTGQGAAQLDGNQVSGSISIFLGDPGGRP
jgi:general secretion pathway protein L